MSAREKPSNSGRSPIPLFDTHKIFLLATPTEYLEERPAVAEFLASFGDQIPAAGDYGHTRGFLKSYSKTSTTFNAYRTQVERLLLWCWIFAGKSVVDLRRSDAEQFMNFCIAPPVSWIGRAARHRFVQKGGLFEPNPEWTPFALSVDKGIRKLAEEKGEQVVATGFKMAEASVGQVFAICSSFFEYLTAEDITQGNPFKAIKDKRRWTRTTAAHRTTKALTGLQWDYVIETAEQMADEEPESHERTLFIVATLFSMYLRVSDIVGRHDWKPTMGAFFKNSRGWWYHVVGKGNFAADVAVRPDYLKYLKRYRLSRNLPPLPAKGENTPLLTKRNGAPDLSDRHIRDIVQVVFDRALRKMQEEGRDEEDVNDLRSATLHWLRHTSATFDAPVRSAKNLQTDLRHKSMSTTQDIYYNSLDEERAHEVSELKVRS
ncbi:TPA: tyrosine-type recombinase/integrase [Pseudomonas aeruginosa]